jgi:hypothetical protein
MKKKIIIKCCDECPYLDWSPNEHGEIEYRCDFGEDVIDDTMVIPVWCFLADDV